MIRQEDMHLTNYSGTLMHRDTPLFYFNIKDGILVNYHIIQEDLMNCPPEIVVMGVTKKALDIFFCSRVVQDGAMWLREYLDALGLDRYDFETIVKKNHGHNYLDLWWVQSDGEHRTFQSLYE